MTTILVIGGLILQLLFYLAVIGIGLFIQVKLSKSENKYLGLIMPVIAFLLAGLVTLGVTSFNMMTTSTVDGVTEVTHRLDYLIAFLIFLVTNIPTFILSGIYYTEQNKKKMNKAIEKMKIEDL